MTINKRHKYNIWQTDDLTWHTYIPTYPKRSHIKNKDFDKLIKRTNEFYETGVLSLPGNKEKYSKEIYDEMQLYSFEKERHLKHKTLKDKKDYIYFITDGIYVKIGKTTNVGKRLGAIRTCNYRDIDLLFSIKCKDAYTAEHKIHNYYKEYNIKGEWFDILNKIDENSVMILIKEHNPIIQYT